MQVFIVYCHPSETSFTRQVKEHFIKGLLDAGHTYEVSDLYKMGFHSDLTQKEYMREAFYKEGISLPRDVEDEQRKIQNADAVVFIYPIFWAGAPAKLVGWFDRVWTCGFTTGRIQRMKTLDKVLVLATAGKTMRALNETGEAEAMETIMLGTRIRDRALTKQMYFLDGVTHMREEQRDKKIPLHLEMVFNLGRDF